MDIGPLPKWKEDEVKRPGWSEISDQSPYFKALWAQWASLHVKNRLLKRAWESPDGKQTTMQLVVPAIKIKKVLQEMHNGGAGAHFGINKTFSKVRERFYWVRCQQDVENWCKIFTTCAAVKEPRFRGKRAAATIQRRSAFRKNCSGHSRSFPDDRGRE